MQIRFSKAHHVFVHNCKSELCGRGDITDIASI